MEDKSTPRPWWYGAQDRGHGHFGPIAIIDASDTVIIERVPSSEVAALIVSAVNSHDGMKEALTEAREYIFCKLGGYSAPRPGEGVMEIIDAALFNLGVETGSAIESPRVMSGLPEAMKECVEALRFFADLGYPEAMAAIKKLEQANG